MACDKELTSLLFRVGNDLVEEDVKNLLFLIGDDIPNSEKEQISTGIEFMTMLRKKNPVGSDLLEHLKSFLSQIRREDLKVQLESYGQKVKSINTAKANVNIAAVPNFVETVQCREVEEHLQKNRLVILSGISASGKTQLTLWCAKRFRSNVTGPNIWKLSCQDENDLIQSLSGILEFFELKFESQKVDKSTYIMEMVSVIIHRVTSEEWQTRQFLFIFDDICKVCSTVVSRIFCELRATTNVKILASTEISTFYNEFKTNDNEVFVSVKGVTIEDVGKFFISSDRFIGCEDDLLLLAKEVGSLPYALMLAKSYMESTEMTVKKYLEMLKYPEFLQSVEKVLESSGKKTYNKGLVGAQILTLEKVEKKVPELGNRLLQMIPFLDCENVPYTLLQKLANDFSPKAEMDIRALICELKSYSLGEIIQTEEETVISLHAVTKLVILHRLTKEERVRIIQKLLWFFSCHLTLDCRLRSSLADNLILQGHAECVLAQAGKNISGSNMKDMCLLQCIIQTAIGVSFRVSGTEHVLADEYLTKARTQMFQLIEESPEKFKLSLDDNESQTYQSDDSDETTTWTAPTSFLIRTIRMSLSLGETTQDDCEEIDGEERSNDSKVKRLYGKLVQVTRDLSPQFIHDFVMNLIRSEVDIQHLQLVSGKSYAGGLETRKQCFTTALYEKLTTVKAAMPTAQIREIFAVELMIIILYNNGRHYYQWKLGEDRSSDKFCCNELLTAVMLGKLLKRDYPNFVSVQYLISHRNGMFYHHETDKRFTQDKEVASVKDDLKETICRLEKMSDKKIRYFEFGILKVSEHQCMHQKGMCLKLILKCYIHLYALCKGKEEEMNEQYTKARCCAEQLQHITKEMHAWTAVPGFHVQLARFYKLKTTQNLLEEAIKHFQIADELETQYNGKGISHFQIQARFGLVKCYKLLRDQESLAKAQGICQYLVTRLDETNLFGIQGKAQRNLDEVQTLLEASLVKEEVIEEKH
ncbi:uncharacterized protein LOC110465497 [Mizuhopecten yessoensis]|uniref:CASP8 and FADD-like apoptosis regulator n=1 Tax=Mizuhopecten yessoensis TaxID=6573 RepID=A0A210PRJ8_MIZYE|nr:uncharacterized protein LOC110465497 [Mizuhopecten yessoensis]XP_021377027.1 uncharacterized protein LOC110465497 [Mizuhopecten yessoensis]XP_021377028.1 uncharacterized protein LOC110465497 [Mizuhopecten yessoensis]XP_021377029.1 uncharacterized protein LOC110465497 [Mizuhopecten yessoensis]OWF39084.1 CASP8 and FADD-like apoptosis regulator [Mizuhopecten yessoensis]